MRTQNQMCCWWLLVLLCTVFSDATSILPASLDKVDLRASYHPSSFSSEQLFVTQLVCIIKLVTSEHIKMLLERKFAFNYSFVLEKRLQMFFPDSKLTPLFDSSVETIKDLTNDPIGWDVEMGQGVRAGQVIGKTKTGRALYSNANGFLVIFPVELLTAMVMELPLTPVPINKEAIQKYLQKQAPLAKSLVFTRSQAIPYLKCYYPSKSLSDDEASRIFRLVLAYIEEQLTVFRTYHQKVGTSPEQLQRTEQFVSTHILDAFYPKHEKQVSELEVGARISKIAVCVGQLVHGKDILYKYYKQRRCIRHQSNTVGFVYQISASRGTLKHPNVLTILRFPAEPENATDSIRELIATPNHSSAISTPISNTQATEDCAEDALSVLTKNASTDNILDIRNFHPAYLGRVRFAQAMQLLHVLIIGHIRRIVKAAEVTRSSGAELSRRLTEMTEKFWGTVFPRSTTVSCTSSSAGKIQMFEQKAYCQVTEGTTIGSLLKVNGDIELIVAPCDGILVSSRFLPGNLARVNDTMAKFQCFSKDEPDVVDNYFIRHGTHADEHTFLLRFKKEIDEVGFEEARIRYVGRVDCYELKAHRPAPWNIGQYKVVPKFHPVTQMLADGRALKFSFPFAVLVVQVSEASASLLATPSTARVCTMNQ